MLFRDIKPRSDDSSGDTLRALWPTAAEPQTFAPPLGVEENDEGFTFAFHVAARSGDELEVLVDGGTLVILGEALPRAWFHARRARRAFTLPAHVDPARAWLSLEPPVLKVHLARKPAGRAIVVRGG